VFTIPAKDYVTYKDSKCSVNIKPYAKTTSDTTDQTGNSIGSTPASATVASIPGIFEKTFPTTNVIYSGKISLGLPFLRNYFSVFNQKDNTISLAPNFIVAPESFHMNA